MVPYDLKPGHLIYRLHSLGERFRMIDINVDGKAYYNPRIIIDRGHFSFPDGVVLAERQVDLVEVEDGLYRRWNERTWIGGYVDTQVYLHNTNTIVGVSFKPLDDEEIEEVKGMILQAHHGWPGADDTVTVNYKREMARFTWLYKMLGIPAREWVGTLS